MLVTTVRNFVSFSDVLGIGGKNERTATLH